MSLPVLRLPKRVYRKMPKSLPLMEQYPLYALSFDGLDDAVKVLHSPSIAPTSVTVEMCVKPNAGYGQVTPRLVRKIGLGGYEVFIDPASGLLVFTWQNALGTTDNVISIAPVPVNVFTHVTCTYDFPNAHIYFNGLLDNSKVTLIQLATSIVDMYIGNRDTHARTLNGLIPYTRIYNYALSQAELQRNMRNPMNPIRTGLMLWHPSIEGQGLTVADYSGNGNNGTLENGVGWYEMALYEALADIQ